MYIYHKGMIWVYIFQRIMQKNEAIYVLILQRFFVDDS